MFSGWTGAPGQAGRAQGGALARCGHNWHQHQLRVGSSVPDRPSQGKHGSAGNFSCPTSLYYEQYPGPINHNPCHDQAEPVAKGSQGTECLPLKGLLLLNFVRVANFVSNLVVIVCFQLSFGVDYAFVAHNWWFWRFSWFKFWLLWQPPKAKLWT